MKTNKQSNKQTPKKRINKQKSKINRKLSSKWEIKETKLALDTIYTYIEIEVEFEENNQ